jgi:hypothetical protein
MRDELVVLVGTRWTFVRGTGARCPAVFRGGFISGSRRLRSRC